MTPVSRFISTCAIFIAGMGVALLAPLAWSVAAPSDGWASLSPGLDWTRLEVETPETERTVRILAVRVDLSRFRLRALDARAHDRNVWSAKEAARADDVLVALNGSFFDEAGKPMGLLIDDGRQLYPLRKADWGVLYVAGGKARIVHSRDFKKTPAGTTFAIQTGPRLVVGGKVTSLKPNFARRSAVCLHADGRVSLVATESAVVLSEFAEILRRSPSEGGLGCPDAINLDGGSSTQLHVQGPSAPRGITAPAEVPVMVGVSRALTP